MNKYKLRDITKDYQLVDMFEKLQQENQQLIAEVKELELIIGLRQTRNLIHKFDKEYDEEDKRKNPNRDYASIMPDAEEVYKRYYEQQERINKAIEYIEKEWCWDGTGIDNLEEILIGGNNE